MCKVAYVKNYYFYIHNLGVLCFDTGIILNYLVFIHHSFLYSYSFPGPYAQLLSIFRVFLLFSNFITIMNDIFGHIYSCDKHIFQNINMFAALKPNILVSLTQTLRQISSQCKLSIVSGSPVYPEPIKPNKISLQALNKRLVSYRGKNIQRCLNNLNCFTCLFAFF